MSRGIQRWSEEAISRLQNEGRGKGRGPTYEPWIRITDFYSEGRTHEPYSHKTKRHHQLLSDGEYDAFVMLEWARNVVDIREQYPLDREISLEIAKELGIKHQYYPGTHIPLVLTVDLLVTKMCGAEETLEAFSVKVAADLENRTVIERLEVERATCQALSVPYHLLVKEHLPKTKLKNLGWIRSAQLDEDRTELYEGFYEEQKALMVQDIAAVRYDGSLVDYCTNYDRRYSVESGTGLRVARMLMSQRTLSMDLNNPEPQLAHMDSFRLSALPGRLRHVAGA
jgi:hypothetical protein